MGTELWGPPGTAPPTVGVRVCNVLYVSQCLECECRYSLSHPLTHLTPGRAGLGEHRVTPQNWWAPSLAVLQHEGVYGLVNFWGGSLRYKGPSDFASILWKFYSSPLQPSA